MEPVNLAPAVPRPRGPLPRWWEGGWYGPGLNPNTTTSSRAAVSDRRSHKEFQGWEAAVAPYRSGPWAFSYKFREQFETEKAKI
eukprot:471885-Rhodomonas_salina.1